MDLVKGDLIQVKEPVFEKYGQPPTGEREFIALIVGDSYGADAGQHMFMLLITTVIAGDGLIAGKAILRKGRTLYKNVVDIFDRQSDYESWIKEKHERAENTAARNIRGI